MNTQAPLVSFPARTHSPAADSFPTVFPNLLAYPLTQSLLIAISSYTLLFLAMDLRVGAYDEGFLLTAAFRQMLGQIPHRDFYFAYGPAQTYLIAALFKLFGTSVLVERLYDLALKAAVVTSIWHFARKLTPQAIALATTAAVFLLLFALPMNGSATVPASLAAFWATWLLIQTPSQNPSHNPFVAGVLTAIALFFRYDVGLALCASNLLLLALLSFSRLGTLRQRASTFIQPAGPYLFAFGLLILPFAALVRSYSAVNDLLFDCFTFPAHFYRAGRSLPFPTLHFRTLDDLAVYLPISTLLATVAFLIQTARRSPHPALANDQKIRPSLLAFSLLTLLFYAKGFTRISPVQLYPALVTSALLLGILIAHRNLLQPAPVPITRQFPRTLPPRTPYFLADHRDNSTFLSPPYSAPLSSQYPPPLSSRGEAEGSASARRTLTLPLIALSVGIASISLVWLSIHRFLDLRNHHAACFESAFTPPAPNQPDTPLTHGVLFSAGDDRLAAINFLRAHTTPLDTLYVGITHHDRIFVNDNLTYFATERLPATKWSEFDPLLQSQLPIQVQMVADLEASQPPYIAIESEFDQVREPNASALSSGVYLLDDYLAQHYHPVQTLPTITLYQRLPR